MGAGKLACCGAVRGSDIAPMKFGPWTIPFAALMSCTVSIGIAL